MGKGLLDPKVDFVFKNIFGSEKHPEILISFLNAIIKPNIPIVGVEIKFHTGYRLKEIHIHEELTDVIEMHFIEIPKLPAEADVTDMLVAWTEFLKNPESEKVRSLELSVKEVREAKDELIRMSNNEEQRALYEMRAKILKDKVSALNKARQEGIKEGIKAEIYAHPSRKFMEQWKEQGIDGLLRIFVMKNCKAISWTMATNFSEKAPIDLC